MSEERREDRQVYSRLWPLV